MGATTADLLVDRLIDWGVDTIFGLPGDGINGIFEALRTRQDKIRFIQVRHEEAAAFAACGYAKYTGRLGVCLATSGPGGIHLLNGLYDAKCDGQPVLAITGHTFHDLIGTHYAAGREPRPALHGRGRLQRTGHGARPRRQRGRYRHQDGARPPRRRPYHHPQRHPGHGPPRTASAPSRNIPGHSADLFARRAADAAPRPAAAAPPTFLNAGKKRRDSGRPRRVSARATKLLALAEQAGRARSSSRCSARPSCPTTAPSRPGGIGLLGHGAVAGRARGTATRCSSPAAASPTSSSIPKPGQARRCRSSIDPARIGLRYPVDVGLVGDCRQVLQALLPLLERKEDRAFLEKAQERHEEVEPADGASAARARTCR